MIEKLPLCGLEFPPVAPVFATAVRRLRPLFGWTGCCIMGQTPLMQSLELVIARLDHHGEYR